MYVRCLDPSVLTFSLTLDRHPSIYILFRSRFTSYNTHTSSYRSGFRLERRLKTVGSEWPGKENDGNKLSLWWDTLTRCVTKEHSPDTWTTTRPSLYNIHNNIPLHVLTPIIPCPDNDRCDTSDVHVHPPRRLVPVISRICPTPGCLYLVKRVTHRTTTYFTVTVPIVLHVPDMCIKVKDNLLVQTISTVLRLNSYDPDWDVFWNLVTEEIPGHLPQQYRTCYITTSFLAQLTWVFLRIFVDREPCAPVCVSTDSRSLVRKKCLCTPTLPFLR